MAVSVMRVTRTFGQHLRRALQSGVRVISAMGQNTYPRSAFFLRRFRVCIQATVIRVTPSGLVDRLLGDVRYLR
jgi:hypothetical protein